VNDASRDPYQIGVWEKQFPNCNWGVDCGGSGLVVIDVDPKDGGFTSIETLESEVGPLPTTLRSRTGSGGMHLFYRSTTVEVPSRVGWLKGVDIRSRGGYVVLPPGIHKSGARYVWEQWCYPTELPDYLLNNISNPKNSTKPLLKDTSEIVLAGVPEGERDDTLFRWACRLRRQHSSDDDGGLAVVTELVLSVAAKSGFPRDQALKKVEQAFKQDHEYKPHTVHSMTDVGNRNRLIDLCGDDIRYVTEWGWMRFTDRGWVPIPEESVVKLAEQVAIHIRQEEVAKGDSDKVRRRILAFADKSESSGSLNNMSKLMRGDQRILRQVKDFDKLDTELVCANGVVDLKTGELREITRDDMTTKNTGVVYDPDIPIDWWLQIVNTMTNGDGEVAEYLQKAAGYTATGLITQECFFVIVGPPASGKSTYIDGIMTALGEYAMNTQPDTFMLRVGSAPNQHELARFSGVRMVSVPETQAGDVYNEGLLKQVTGGDILTARHLYKKAFDYRPKFKLWINSNNDAISQDYAILRRIKRIKFNHTIPYNKRDTLVKNIVKDRETGSKMILKWIVQGAVKFLESGSLTEPIAITMAAHEYQSMTDMMSMFLSDCIVHKGQSVSVLYLYRYYSDWCRSMRQQPDPFITFKKKLTDRGINTSRNDRGVEMFLEIGVGSSLPTMPQI
jgi:P4 family phage/plasmid primase-like protien